MHPVRPVQLRLPALRHPGEVLRRGRARAARRHGFKSAPVNARGYPRRPLHAASSTSRTAPAAACASRSARRYSPRRAGRRRRSICADKAPLLEAERANIAFFETLPVNDRARVDFANVRGVQFLEPLFEFSGACARLRRDAVSQAALAAVRRPRCRSPTPPAARRSTAATCRSRRGPRTSEGRGPAWSNSLFEDNAEFGLGFRLAADKHLELAATLLRGLAPQLGAELVEAILDGAADRASPRSARSASGSPS